MNKKLFLIVSAVFALSIAALLSLFLFFVYSAGAKSITKISSDTHSAYLNEIIYNYKNDLVSGNYRFFRNQISSLIDHDVFASYQIIQNGKVLDASDDFEKNVLQANFSKVKVPVWFDEGKSSLWGEVELLVNIRAHKQLIDKLFENLELMVFLVIAIISFLMVLSFYFWQHLNLALIAAVDDIFLGGPRKVSGLGFSLWQPMLNQFRKLKSNHDQLFLNEQEVQRKVLLVKLSRQVAHDIRSPLSAINLAIQGITDLPEGRRQIIEGAAKRINEIANDLLKREPVIVSVKGASESSQNRNFQALPIYDIVTEMYRESCVVHSIRSEIEFVLDLMGEADSALCRIDQKELLRVLSNLINNSVEATTGAGQITLAVRSTLKEVSVIISDNGKGIPTDLLDRLGNEGVSFGKELTSSGSGLGIFHAKKAVELMSGKFTIQSSVDVGTIVTITFPKLNFENHT